MTRGVSKTVIADPARAQPGRRHGTNGADLQGESVVAAGGHRQHPQLNAIPNTTRVIIKIYTALTHSSIP